MTKIASTQLGRCGSTSGTTWSAVASSATSAKSDFQSLKKMPKTCQFWRSEMAQTLPILSLKNCQKPKKVSKSPHTDLGALLYKSISRKLYPFWIKAVHWKNKCPKKSSLKVESTKVDFPKTAFYNFLFLFEGYRNLYLISGSTDGLILAACIFFLFSRIFFSPFCAAVKQQTSEKGLTMSFFISL